MGRKEWIILSLAALGATVACSRLGDVSATSTPIRLGEGTPVPAWQTKIPIPNLSESPTQTAEMATLPRVLVNPTEERDKPVKPVQPTIKSPTFGVETVVKPPKSEIMINKMLNKLICVSTSFCVNIQNSIYGGREEGEIESLGNRSLTVRAEGGQPAERIIEIARSIDYSNYEALIFFPEQISLDSGESPNKLYDEKIMPAVKELKTKNPNLIIFVMTAYPTYRPDSDGQKQKNRDLLNEKIKNGEGNGEWYYAVDIVPYVSIITTLPDGSVQVKPNPRYYEHTGNPSDEWHLSMRMTADGKLDPNCGYYQAMMAINDTIIRHTNPALLSTP